MNSPYMGNFKVTQIQHASHDGLDLVGIDSKEIHATVSGVIQYAGWQNPNNEKEGFGQYVCIYDKVTKLYYYYGHLSKIRVKTGDLVKCTDVIGIEGHTGYTIPDNENGSHCHYCVRPYFRSGCCDDISKISGIPNKLGTYNDGYKPTENKPTKRQISITVDIDDHKYSGLIEEE